MLSRAALVALQRSRLMPLDAFRIRARFLQLTKQHSGTRGWSRRCGCTRQSDPELTKLARLRIAPTGRVSGDVGDCAWLYPKKRLFATSEGLRRLVDKHLP